MEETNEPTKEEEAQEGAGETNENNGDGISTEEKPISIAEANRIVSEMKKQNEERKKLLDREEQIIAQKKLMGQTTITKDNKEVKEESAQDYAKRALEGNIKDEEKKD